jgi:branched-chain amino acid aminotransferase
MRLGHGYGTVSMPALVDVDGTLLPAGEARIPVYDQGFLFGASVYETVRTYGGRPFLLDRHLERLARSARSIHMDPEAFLPGLRARIDRALAAASHGDSRLRIIVTRGRGSLLYDLEVSDHPTVVVIVEALEPASPEDRERGVTAAVVSVRRNSALALDPAIKSSNLLNNFLAAVEARHLGADEALMLNERGELAEGSSANLFLVTEEQVRTPPPSAGLLDGITRGFVLDLCRRENIPVEESVLLPQALYAADEIFLTSTTREVLPVRRCDGRTVASGTVGPLTRRIQEAFSRAVAVDEEGRR